MSDFVAFILTHGRADNVITYDTLKKCGYTGDVVIVIDNEDKTKNEYIEKFGKENIYIFDKEAVSKTFDEADNFNDRRAIVYARNACFDIAKKLGYRYFIQLDDDYTGFEYKFDKNFNGSYTQITNLDDVFKSYLGFLKIDKISSVAMAQGGDFIGGPKEKFKDKIELKRKCMNTFFCDTEKPFKFIGRINEDVNTYTLKASQGLLLFTNPMCSIVQKQTQSNSGGMTDIYLDNGTYIKSFYTIIFSPSCAKIKLMGESNRRLHHSISWRNAVPLILNEKVKK